MNLFVRSDRQTSSLLKEIRRQSLLVDPGVAMYDAQTLGDLAMESRGHKRFLTLLLVLFAVVALLLAATGIYGVMAFSVIQRTRELGIRMALGASRSMILRQVLAYGMILTATGSVLGLVAALFLSRFLESQLYGVEGSDPLAMAATAAGMGLIGLLACYLPAQRASRADPLIALRNE